MEWCLNDWISYSHGLWRIARDRIERHVPKEIVNWQVSKQTSRFSPLWRSAWFSFSQRNWTKKSLMVSWLPRDSPLVFGWCFLHFFSKVVDNWCYQLRLSRYIVMGFSFWDSKCTVPSVTVTGTFATLQEAFFVVKSTRDRLHIEVPYICSATYGGPIPNDMVAQRFPIFGYDKKMIRQLYNSLRVWKNPVVWWGMFIPKWHQSLDIQCHLLRFGIWTPEICIAKSKPQKVFI